MKFTIVSVATLLVTIFTQAAADINLGSLPDVVYIGYNYTLEWSATYDYIYDLWIVEEIQSEGIKQFDTIREIAVGLHPRSVNGSYTWTVPSNLGTLGNYAIWISGIVMSTEFSGDSESAQTNWFNIQNAPSPSSTVSGGASKTPSPTASVASSTNSAVSVANSSMSISGGAIAGIVIGCIVLIALVVGAVLFAGWRRKRSAKQKREAEARANRLAPVMKKESGSFEMHSKLPEMNKEFDA